MGPPAQAARLRRGCWLPEGWQRVRRNKHTAYKAPDGKIYGTLYRMEHMANLGLIANCPPAGSTHGGPPAALSVPDGARASSGSARGACFRANFPVDGRELDKNPEGPTDGGAVGPVSPPKRARRLPEGWQRVRRNTNTAYKAPGGKIYGTLYKMDRALKKTMRTT